MLRFTAQIKQVSIRETVSNDKEVTIKITTEDAVAVELQKYIATEPVVIEVKEV